jgi:Na+-driven multidrug efflux pump
MIDNMLNSIIRADGSPKFAMFATLTGCMLNIILDPIAIFALGWGMAGAALATIIGQIIAAVLAFTYLFRTKSFKLDKKSFKPDFNIIKNVLSMGLSSLFTQLSVVFLMAVMNNTLRTYGANSVYGADIPIAVIGIIMKVFMLVTSMAVGFSVGLQPIVGYNKGAGNKERVKEIFRKMLTVEFSIGIVALALFQIFPTHIVGLFGSGDALYNEFATLAMRIHLGGVTLFCMQRGCAIFMQSLGKPMLSAFTTFLRELLLNIPMIVIFASLFGVTGTLFASPVADIISFTVTLIITLKVVGKFVKGTNIQ